MFISERETSYIEKLASYIRASFLNVPLPRKDQIWDPSPSGSLTSALQERLAGKPWAGLSLGEAETLVSLSELSQPAYAYYIQAPLLFELDGVPRGLYPEAMGLCYSADYRESGASARLARFLDETLAAMMHANIMTATQVGCIALHVELYGLMGDEASENAFKEFWSRFAPAGFFGDPA